MGDWRRRVITATLAAVAASGFGGYWLLGLEPGAKDPSGPVIVEGGAPGPVLVELFTSEGCSSCPPADRLLAELVEAGGVAGVPIVALEEHVSYWNYLGWRDPFSSAAFSRRQERYARALPSRVYTPQMVVDGREGLVGSVSHDVRHAIERAGRTPKLQVALTPAREDGGRLRVSWRVSTAGGHPLRRGADVLLAITEDDLTVDVGSGENGGRRLQHVAVVRHLASVGELDADDHELTDDSDLRVSPEWNPSALRAAVFVQDQRTLAVLGAASVALDRSPPAR